MLKANSKILTILLLFLTCAGNAQLTPLNIGNIGPNDSVVIYFDVTINAGLPAGTRYIATQATITGSNFSSLLSDDPDTGEALDSTKTFLTFSTLPVHFISLGATRNNNAVEVKWKVAGQVNVDHYVVERSATGIQFDAVGQVQAFTGTDQLSYSHNDFGVPAGVLYYRIRSVDADRRKQFSLIVRVNPGAEKGSMSLLPTITRERRVLMQLNGHARSQFNVEVYTDKGQLILRQKINSTGTAHTEMIELPHALTAGVYYIRVRNETVSYTGRVIIQ